MADAFPGLARFQSIKQVSAGEIVEVVPAGCYVRQPSGDAVLLTYQDGMTARYTPVPGDYWVVYDGDRYASISPREQFLAGYLPAGSDHDAIARVCHEVNRAYCASIGDHSQVAWEDAPEWQRRSAVKGVAFTLAHPDAKPSDSHESWLAEKRADGWKYGPVKLPDAKEHPCFVPYDELPVEQRAKDYLFQAVIRSMSPA